MTTPPRCPLCGEPMLDRARRTTTYTDGTTEVSYVYHCECGGALIPRPDHDPGP